MVTTLQAIFIPAIAIEAINIKHSIIGGLFRNVTKPVDHLLASFHGQINGRQC